MRLIGLTGGIGSGKSTASAYLRKKKIFIIDADAISRRLTAKGGKALPKIREYFGDDVFFDDGSLDRKKLAQIVFSNKEKLSYLESITTDVVVNEITEILEILKRVCPDETVVCDAPLLFETLSSIDFSETWLVTCDIATRIHRISERDNISEEEIKARIENQMPDSEKMKRATFVLDNSKSKEELYSQIDRLLEKNEEV